MTFATRSLFDEGWLAPFTPDVTAAAAEAAIAAAELGLDRALAGLRAELAALAAGGEARWIGPLLRAETEEFPQAGKAAWAAVEHTMRAIAFKRRELMPHFPGLLDRVEAVHEEASALCGEARWSLLAARALADPGGPSSPIQGHGTRYVKSDRYDARALAALPPDERVRADRTLKRLGGNPVPPELDLRSLPGYEGRLWTMKAGGRNRFILRLDRDRRGPVYVVEDVALAA